MIKLFCAVLVIVGVVGLCIQWNSEYRVNKVISALEQYGVYAGDIVLTDKEIDKVRERSMYYPDAPLDIGSPCKSEEDFSVLVVESGNTVYKNTWHEWPIR